MTIHLSAMKRKIEQLYQWEPPVSKTLPGKDYSFKSWNFGVSSRLNIHSIWSFSHVEPSRIVSWNDNKVFLKDILLKIYSRGQGLYNITLTITSTQMIPYEKVIYFKYTKNTCRTASTSWENFEKRVQKNLLAYILLLLFFILFIDLDNDIIVSDSIGLTHVL